MDIHKLLRGRKTQIVLYTYDSFLFEIGEGEKDIEIETDALLMTIQTAKTVSLKKGAVVMCTTNISIEDGICNGSQGVVIDFVESSNRECAGMLVPLVKFSNGRIMRISPQQRQSVDFPSISVSQIPLCLAWALTIHKIQGATLHMADIDIGRTIFEYGQTYVALSRIRSLDGLFLSEFYPQRIKANPTVIAFYESFPDISHETMQSFIDMHTQMRSSQLRPPSTFLGNTITNYIDHSRKDIKVVSW